MFTNYLTVGICKNSTDRYLTCNSNSQMINCLPCQTEFYTSPLDDSLIQCVKDRETEKSLIRFLGGL